MSITTEYSRLLIKRSTVAGVVPTIPTASTIDNTWLTTDLMVGEMFINVADDRVFLRSDNGIIELIQTGGTDTNYYTTGATLVGNTIFFDRNDMLSAYTVDLSTIALTGDYLPLSGGTLTGDLRIDTNLYITGNTIADELSATTITILNSGSTIRDYYDYSSNLVQSGVTNSSIVAGSGNTIVSGVRNVLIAGSGITGSTSDTAYFSKVNISTVPTGTTVSNLGVDANGNVIVATGASGSSGTSGSSGISGANGSSGTSGVDGTSGSSGSSGISGANGSSGTSGTSGSSGISAPINTYLPLSGGTMTGNISMSASTVIQDNASSQTIQFDYDDNGTPSIKLENGNGYQAIIGENVRLVGDGATLRITDTIDATSAFYVGDGFDGFISTRSNKPLNINNESLNSGNIILGHSGNRIKIDANLVSGSPVANLSINSQGYIISGSTALNYLPLSGGTLTGNLKMGTGTFITNNVGDGRIEFKTGFFGDGIEVNSDGGAYSGGSVTILDDYSALSNYSANGLAALYGTNGKYIEVQNTSGNILLETNANGYISLSSSDIYLYDTNNFAGTPLVNLGIDTNGKIVSASTVHSVWKSGSTGSYSIQANNPFAKATADYAIAGGSSSATTTSAVAFGEINTASGNGAFAMGASNTASGLYAAAIGANNIAQGNYSMSLGKDNTLNGIAGFAANSDNLISGNYSFTLGSANQVTGDYAGVFGDSSKAAANSVFVLGSGITGSTANTTYVDKLNIKTIGSGSPIINLGVDSSGNVVTGTTGGGAAPEKYWTSGSTASSIMPINPAGVFGTITNAAATSLVFGWNSKINAGLDNYNIGFNSTISDGQANFNFGGNNNVGGVGTLYAMAIGQSNNVSSWSIAIGAGHTTTAGSNAYGNVAIGSTNYHNSANGTISLGSYCYVNAQHSIATGYNTRTNASYSWAGGYSPSSTYRVIANSEGSFCWMNSSGTQELGTYAEKSTILGGLDHKINTSATGSTIIGGINNRVNSSVVNSTVLGGSAITATTSNTTYVPALTIVNSSTPASSGATGDIGSVTWDDNYMYVKTNTGWGRIALDYNF